MLSLSVPHKCVKTSQLGYNIIPAGTQVSMNLRALHHDEQLWDEPFKFIAERFLDEDSEVVDADHPNRKNLMLFGAGNWVCVEECSL